MRRRSCATLGRCRVGLRASSFSRQRHPGPALPSKSQSDRLRLWKGPVERAINSDVESESYRSQLLESLDNFVSAISQLNVLPRVFDDEWKKVIAIEIGRVEPNSGPFQSPKCPLFFLCKDHLGQLGEIDRRLAALEALAPTELHEKIHEIRACRFSDKQLQHFFETNVLGLFARMGKLREVQVRIGAGSVDGRLLLHTRPVLIEATLATQALLASEPGAFSAAIEPLMNQIVHKVRKKVADGKQLALAGGEPAVLVVGLHPFGADQLCAEWAIAECFSRPSFACCSAIVISDSWRFQVACLRVNSSASNPLDDVELEQIRTCLRDTDSAS